MQSRGLVILLLAVVLGGAAVWLARGWLESQVRVETIVQEAPAKPAAAVVVARTPLSFGNNIRREHLRVVDWPTDSVPDGAFTSIEDILGDGTQRVALRSIAVNEPVLADKVSGFGGRATLSAVISDDMRASTVRVNDINGVAGFVLPGDHVDILLTRQRNDRLITDVLLQNVLVLGIDQDANDDREQPAVVKAVTLEVTPVQSQKLTLAQQVGSLSLALRAVTDTEADTFVTITEGDLTVGEANTPTAAAAAPPAAAPAPVAQVRVTNPRRKPKSLVNVVRGLAETEYDVKPERGVPTVTTIAPATAPVAEPAAPAPAPVAAPVPAPVPPTGLIPELISQQLAPTELGGNVQ